MIVKIERYAERHGFVLVDNVSEIHKTDGWKPCPLRMGDILIEDYEEATSQKTTGSSYKIALHCIKRDGSEITIVFDTVVYVMNDNSKTIEKIIANDRMSLVEACVNN